MHAHIACAGYEDDDAAAERELQIARSEAAATGLDVVAAGRFGPAHGGSALATCERAGRRWRVTVASRSVLVEDSIGMLHLAVLIANPRQDVAAAELVQGWPYSVARPPAPRLLSRFSTARRS